MGPTIMLHPESSCVCISNFRPFIFLAKVPFLAFFNYRKGCGYINILKAFSGDTNSKYIWVC